MIKSLKIIYLCLYVFLFLFLFFECYGLFANLFLSLSMVVVEVLFSDFVLCLLFCIWVVVLFGRLCQSCLFGNCNERKRQRGNKVKIHFEHLFQTKRKCFVRNIQKYVCNFVFESFSSLFFFGVYLLHLYVCMSNEVHYINTCEFTGVLTARSLSGILTCSHCIGTLSIFQQRYIDRWYAIMVITYIDDIDILKIDNPLLNSNN